MSEVWIAVAAFAVAGLVILMRLGGVAARRGRSKSADEQSFSEMNTKEKLLGILFLLAVAGVTIALIVWRHS